MRFSIVAVTAALVFSAGALALGAVRPKAQNDSHSNAPTPGPGTHCSAETLLGTYGVSFSGTVTAFGAIAGIATVAVDRTGHASGAYAESLNGTTIRGNFTGNFTVRSDCTGAAELAGLIAGSWTANLNFVVVNKGAELLMVGTDPGVIVSGSAKR